MEIKTQFGCVHLRTFATARVALDHHHRIGGNFLQNFILCPENWQRVSLDVVVELVFVVHGIMLIRIDVELFTGLNISRLHLGESLRLKKINRKWTLVSSE